MSPASLSTKLRKAYEEGVEGQFGLATYHAGQVLQEAAVLLAAGPSAEAEDTLLRLISAAEALIMGVSNIAEAGTKTTQKTIGDWAAAFDRPPLRQNGRRSPRHRARTRV